jgi:hypothetical protein
VWVEGETPTRKVETIGVWVAQGRGGRTDAAGKEAASQGGGMFRGLIDIIIGNLQMSITNIHVRYEVCTTFSTLSRPRERCACGSMWVHVLTSEGCPAGGRIHGLKSAART